MPDTTTPTIERPTWLPEEVWPFRLRRFDRGGRTIHYVDEGDGPTLALVHAGMWSFVWRDVIAALGAEFRCITLDFPGAGLSDGGRRDVALAEYPAIVDELLDHLGIEHATFVVHDLGGVVGVHAAARRPERVDGIVAINSFAWPPDARPLKMMLGVMGSRTATATLGTVGLVPRLSRTSFGVGRHLDRQERKAFYGPYRRGGRRRNFHRAMRSARRSGDLFEASAHALRTTLRGVPVLTIFGEKNDPFGFADTWRELFPAAEQHVVEAGNHFPMCDAPEAVARWIARWHRSRVAAEV